MEHRDNRRDLRPLLPNNGPVVAVQLERDRLRLAGRLWDVSRHGACLCTHGQGPTPALEEPAVLLIADPGGGSDLELCVRVVWLEQVDDSRFVGVEFLAPIDFGATFLGRLIRNEESRLPRPVPRPAG